MRESFENKSTPFLFPNIEREAGEFERVAKSFGLETSTLMSQATKGELVDLDDETWQRLENTDSNQLEAGDWKKVEEYSAHVNRDWAGLRDKIISGEAIDAPIIMKFGERYHLVSGNTRLMITKAIGIKPHVLIFRAEI